MGSPFPLKLLIHGRDSSGEGLALPRPIQCSLLFYTVREKLQWTFKGMVLKAPNSLGEALVILLEQWLAHHRLYLW